MFLCKASARWSAYLDSLELFASDYTAAYIEYDFADRGSHGDFDQAGVVYLACKGENFCSA